MGVSRPTWIKIALRSIADAAMVIDHPDDALESLRNASRMLYPESISGETHVRPPQQISELSRRPQPAKPGG
jgi:hypothetical protein